ncbi:MAG: tRNA (guanosine(46)-N7)-methyltransferase TrmB [Mycoplasma sp.]|nr:tRNA (guanosine(46)-N7)-methyltransferase TrmB [Mycoplasma sp.]
MGRLRKIKNDLELVQSSNYYFKTLSKNKNQNYLDIGMGKGDFIINMALTNNKINFYGLDKFPTVIYKAINKLNNFDKPIKNIKFLAIDVINIFKYFPKKYIDKIFLNFSDPWPKKRHAKRRLTSNTYLDFYKQLLNKNGVVEFKTDNDNLYEYSLETIKNRKDIKIIKFSKNLYKSNKTDTILTEYEKKFIGMGIPIKYISFKFD